MSLRKTLLLSLAPAALGLGCDPEEAPEEEGCELEDVRECEVDGEQGEQTCVEAEGEPVWGECRVPTPDWSGGSDTPLLLVFDGAAVEFSASAGELALNPRMSVVTDWPGATTPWLVWDRDRSGVIEDGSELFGSATQLASGKQATHGFEALSELDGDGDARIAAFDPTFGELALWFDHDGDRRSAPDELRPLSDAGVVELDLRFAAAPRCDARGNCEVERASFRFRGGDGALHEGALVDVHLAHQLP
jgi:hypothetical protein